MNKLQKQAVKDIVWMARRYAEGRKTYAPSMFNHAYDALKEIIDFDEANDPDNRDDEYRPITNFPHATHGSDLPEDIFLSTVLCEGREDHDDYVRIEILNKVISFLDGAKIKYAEMSKETKMILEPIKTMTTKILETIIDGIRKESNKLTPRKNV